MPNIHALPDTTVRALGSGQVLTDPVALIKELIENSLDAKATQITIEVSPNLLDSVLVRDNGFGIAPDDRASTCKRHFTSKISAFDDIATVGTLGFRGEALASASEMSEKLVFTSRVEGESVAEVYSIARDGGVKERRSVGAPIGTMVKVEGFLKRLPVRRESVVRMQKQLVKRLKELVARYYLSRPSCRFSLKILAKGSASGKEDLLVYAPSKTVPEAVRKVVGKDVAAACDWVVKEKEGITIEAFLAKSDCRGNVALLEKPGCTHYVFVDSRPISCARGPLSTIRKLYKSHIRAVCGDGEKTTPNPLLYLHIRCPKGIYDSNVEPAKDDVLFDGSRDVVATVEELFKDVYGELVQDGDSSRKGKDKESLRQSIPDAGFEVLLARKKDVAEEVQPARRKDVVDEDLLTRKDVIDDLESLLPPPPPPLEEEPEDLEMDERAIEAEKEQLRKDITLSNPWTIAKMNTPNGPSRHQGVVFDATSTSPVRRPAVVSSPTRGPTMRPSSVNAPSSPIRAPLPPITTPSPTRPPYNPSFTPVNPLRPRPDAGNSSTSPQASKIRRGYGIPPVFSPQRQQQQSTLLEDPGNAGAMDRFIVRIPRALEQTQRPIPRGGFGGEDLELERQKRARPLPTREEEDMEAEQSRERPRRRPEADEEDDAGAPEHHNRLRAVRPRGDFTTAAAVYDALSSAQFDHAPPPRKRQRVQQEPEDEQPRQTRNPNRNRFLSATAALRPGFTGDVYGTHESTSPRRRGIPPPLPPSLLSSKSQEETAPPSHRLGVPPLPLLPSLLSPPQELDPPRHATSTREGRRRTLPAPPLLPVDEEFQTHKLILQLPPTVGLESIRGMFRRRGDTKYRFPDDGDEGVYRGFCWDVFGKDAAGEAVKGWVERVTGETEEGVVGWEVGEGEGVGGVGVLKAVYR